MAGHHADAGTSFASFVASVIEEAIMNKTKIVTALIVVAVFAGGSALAQKATGGAPAGAAPVSPTAPAAPAAPAAPGVVTPGTQTPTNPTPPDPNNPASPTNPMNPPNPPDPGSSANPGVPPDSNVAPQR
jgi:hypothetical protein